jgi:hypothetical protein
MSTWRVRCLLTSFANLPEQFFVRNCSVSVKKIGETANGSNQFLLDLIIETEKIEDAATLGIDLSNEITDRICYLSNAPSQLEIISVTTPKLNIGEIGKLCLFQGNFHMSSVNLSKEKIEIFDQFKENSNIRASLHNFRIGISNFNPYESFKNLWSSLELLVKDNAKKLPMIEKRCPGCDVIISSHPHEQKVIREYYEIVHKTGMDKEADNLRKFRGKLTHGCVADEKLRNQTEEQITKLEPISLTLLSKETGVKPERAQTFHTGIPLLILEIEKTGNKNTDIEIKQSTSFEVKASFPKIPQEYAEENAFQFFVGIKPPIQINPISLPD